jgi:FMN-dependent NADH-azoreductase
MSHLLHIDSSIRPIEQSRSRKLSARYVEHWQAANPDGTVTYRDLTVSSPPPLDAVAYSAMMTAPDQLSAGQHDALALGRELAGEVAAADTIVLAMGLYNFTVPSTVHLWYDRIVVPGLTLGADYGGLLGDKRLVLVLAAGGGYGEGTPRFGWDHREPWLAHAFGFLGLTDIVTISTELTLARESPGMIPLNLGEAEDQSFAAAEASVDAQFAVAR